MEGFLGFLLLVSLILAGVVGLIVWSGNRQREAAAINAARQREWAAAEAERQRQLAAAEAERRRHEHRRFAAERLRRQLAKWPEGTKLDDHVKSVDGMVPQVAAQNKKIESDIRQIENLLHDGLTHRQAPEPTRGYLAGDADSIAEYIASILTEMQLRVDSPKAKVAYTPQSRQLVVEHELPAVDVIPKAKSYRYVNTQDKVLATARPASQIKSLFASAIAQLTLLSVAQIFRVDLKQHIDVVVFNGIVDTIDPRTGKPTRPCLITLRTTRDAFTEINLEQVEPAACLKYLNAGVSRSPTELVPVRPVLEFSMVDPRFVTETDTLGALDNRPNLMELTPQQFESLIQNLFEKIGLDTRQTRPSRDGGVDCIAYNTDPILGGKVVIQAKRYKHTVGVSAVRDLYGTLQNEGASKGILVTTSGYGKASFDFAQGKPLELFDGTHLLYLLETHAGIKARIEPPEDWTDPVPDSGEAPVS
ncbi:restriction endonuclease [Mycobacterium sp. 94-17]|uniref:restriction endonuclease n=1 Tax=Mycobacterium sp. 94-17 TaxID=2986147 RepID=UPI002D1E6380|nr:restriction endonuclease [Mycobacterium sp. 94-17]MEB4211728.1 restriction endonuclease [Mycobacterium sp. 94-17]